MQSGNRIHWRPRFSLRSLAIAVTFACLYLGSWNATQRFGVAAVISAKSLQHPRSRAFGGYAPLPFVVGVSKTVSGRTYRQHCLWLFGLTIPIPLEWRA